VAEDEDRIGRSMDDVVTGGIGGDGMAGTLDLHAGSRWVDAGTEADGSRYFQLTAAGIGHERVTGGGAGRLRGVPNGGSTLGKGGQMK